MGMSEQFDEYPEYYEQRYNEIPADIKEKAIAVLKKELYPESIANIQKKIDEEGLIEWAIPYHFGWGTDVRNLLRKHVCTDDHLPTGWDDYYIQIVEAAVGRR
jgi:hypothetical protein